MLQAFGAPQYKAFLAAFLITRQSLTERYAMARQMVTIPLAMKDGKTVALSLGDHSELIRAIVERWRTLHTGWRIGLRG